MEPLPFVDCADDSIIDDLETIAVVGVEEKTPNGSQMLAILVLSDAEVVVRCIVQSDVETQTA